MLRVTGNVGSAVAVSDRGGTCQETVRFGLILGAILVR
jgi:ribosomal protein L14